MTTRRRPARTPRPRRPALPAWITGPGTTSEEVDGLPVEVRTLQPYQATKVTTCPGCHTSIPPATGHLVVVPVGHPEDRRHWHRSCWTRRARRRSR